MSNIEINLLFLVHLIIHTLDTLIIFEKVKWLQNLLLRFEKPKQRSVESARDLEFQPLGAGWILKSSIVIRREYALQECFLNYMRK